MNQLNQLLCLLFFVGFSQIITAQGFLQKAATANAELGNNWYQPAKQGADVGGSYIITLENDTLYGEIMYDYPPRMARKIFFRPEGQGGKKRTKYKAKELKGFSFMDQYWVSKEFNDGSLKVGKQKEKLFLRTIYSGKLSVYEYNISEVEDLVKSEGNTISILPEQMKAETWIQKEGEKLIGLNNIKFMRFHKGMSKYLSDCKSLSKEIADKKFKKYEIVTVARQYEACE